jgi:hypothetical protein
MWAYAVEGYEFQGVKYLPDFYLPGMNVLLEVKGHSNPGVEKPTKNARWPNPEQVHTPSTSAGDDLAVSGHGQSSNISLQREARLVRWRMRCGKGYRKLFRGPVSRQNPNNTESSADVRLIAIVVE